MWAAFLQEAASTAPEVVARPTWLQVTITITLAVLGLLGAVLKILKQSSVIKDHESRKEAVETTEKLNVALMEAIDGIKPILGTANAKHVTGAITAHAKDKGVHSHLDQLLKANGLNQ